VQDHLNEVGFKNKFLRYWGHDGSILTEKHYYYPNISENDKKLFKLLGVYKDLKAAQGQMEGIDKAWMYLNPSKEGVVDLTEETLVQELDFDINSGTYTLNITYSPTLKRVGNNAYYGKMYVDTEDTLGLFSEVYKNPDGTINVDTLGNYITANYDEVLSSCVVEGTEQIDDETDDTEAELINLVTMFVLGGSDAFVATIEDISYTTVSKTYASTRLSADGDTQEKIVYPYLEQALSLEINIENIGIVTDTDPLVAKIIEYKDKQQTIKDAAAADKATNGLLGDILYKQNLVNNSLWTDSRLNVAAFSSNTLKTKDLIKLVTTSLDSGYRKKKTKWWKKVLTMIVFVLVMVYTPSLGKVLGLLTSTSSAIAVAATGVTLATLAVSLLSVGMSAWGDEAGATFAGKFAKNVSVLSTFLGVTAMISSMANNVLQYGVKGVIQTAFKKYTTDLSLTQGLKMVTMVANAWMKKDLKKDINKMQALEAQNAEYARAEEENNTRHLAMLFAKGYADVLNKDCNDDQYDYPYEDWGTNMHIGNIQRTSWRWERTGAKDGLRIT